MASNRWVRWVVGAAALAVLTITSSPGSRNVSATTRYIGSDHIVSWSPLPDETGQMCPMPEENSSYQTRGGGAGAAQGAPSFSQPGRGEEAPRH